MKRHILVTIQGAGVFILDHVQPDQDWNAVFDRLDSLKSDKLTHSRVLSSSRKLLKGLQLIGQAVPSEIKPISLWELKLVWFYKGLYLEISVTLDKRKTPRNGTLEPVGKNLSPVEV